MFYILKNNEVKVFGPQGQPVFQGQTDFPEFESLLTALRQNQEAESLQILHPLVLAQRSATLTQFQQAATSNESTENNASLGELNLTGRLLKEVEDRLQQGESIENLRKFYLLAQHSRFISDTFDVCSVYETLMDAGFTLTDQGLVKGYVPAVKSGHDFYDAFHTGLTLVPGQIVSRPRRHPIVERLDPPERGLSISANPQLGADMVILEVHVDPQDIFASLKPGPDTGDEGKALTYRYMIAGVSTDHDQPNANAVTDWRILPSSIEIGGSGGGASYEYYFDGTALKEAMTDDLIRALRPEEHDLVPRLLSQAREVYPFLRKLDRIASNLDLPTISFIAPDVISFIRQRYDEIKVQG